jgi:hypothetical protein
MNHSSCDYIFTLTMTIEEAKANKNKVYCYFVNYCKAFDDAPRHILFKRLKVFCGLIEIMTLCMMTLYENIIHQLCAKMDNTNDINKSKIKGHHSH